MASPFILLATQRSGSSWVQEMLNSHPEMRVYTELFLPDAEGKPIWGPDDVEFHRTFLEGRRASHLRIGRFYWTVQYLRRVFGSTDAAVIGFKYMYNQIPHSEAVLPYAAGRRVKVVHLVRRNMLDIVISAELANATHLYHLAGDERPIVPWWPSERVEASITLDVPTVTAELERLTRERQRMRRWLRRTRTPHYELEYEQASDDEEVFRSVLDFLGLQAPPSGLHSGLEKLRTRSQAEVVENLDEIGAALSGTPYETFVDL